MVFKTKYMNMQCAAGVQWEKIIKFHPGQALMKIYVNNNDLKVRAERLSPQGG